MILRTSILTLILAVSCPLYADTQMEVKTGTLKMGDVHKKEDKNPFAVEIGKKVQGKVFIYHDKSSDKHVINANAEFKNSTKDKVYLVYYVALKDSNGQLVGSTFGDMQIPADKNIHEFGSALIPLPSPQIANVANYEVVLYESDKPLGTE